MRAVAIAVLALALLPAAAAAKTGISLDSTPEGLTAGEPWDVQFQYVRNDEFLDPDAGSQPAVEITSEDGSRKLSFPGRRLHNGMWAARVVFPQAGRWTYEISGFGPRAHRQSWDPATILPTARSPQPRDVKAGAGGGFPVGWIAGGSSIAIALGLLVVRRRASRSRDGRAAPRPGASPSAPER